MRTFSNVNGEPNCPNVLHKIQLGVQLRSTNYALFRPLILAHKLFEATFLSPDTEPYSRPNTAASKTVGETGTSYQNTSEKLRTFDSIPITKRDVHGTPQHRRPASPSSIHPSACRAANRRHFSAAAERRLARPGPPLRRSTSRRHGPGEYCAGPALQARLHEIILQSLSSALFAERAWQQYIRLLQRSKLFAGWHWPVDPIQDTLDSINRTHSS